LIQLSLPAIAAAGEEIPARSGGWNGRVEKGLGGSRRKRRGGEEKQAR
jgi:hypothetical protein